MTAETYVTVERLVRATIAGDHESFSALYDATVERVLGVVSRILGPGRLAEEITARVYESVWSHREEPPNEAGLPWLIDLARRSAIAQKRSRVPRQRTAPVVTLQSPVELDPGWAPALKAEERSALDLVYLGGLTTSEADQRLGWLSGTTNLALRQAMLHLAETENARGEDAPLDDASLAAPAAVVSA